MNVPSQHEGGSRFVPVLESTTLRDLQESAVGLFSSPTNGYGESREECVLSLVCGTFPSKDLGDMSCSVNDCLAERCLKIEDDSHIYRGSNRLLLVRKLWVILLETFLTTLSCLKPSSHQLKQGRTFLTALFNKGSTMVGEEMAEEIHNCHMARSEKSKSIKILIELILIWNSWVLSNPAPPPPYLTLTKL